MTKQERTVVQAICTCGWASPRGVDREEANADAFVHHELYHCGRYAHWTSVVRLGQQFHP